MATRQTLTRWLLAVTMTMSTAEFVDVQKLSAEDLRARFGLSASCQPVVTALGNQPRLNRVTVAIDCRAEHGTPAASPSGRPRPGASDKSGR